MIEGVVIVVAGGLISIYLYDPKLLTNHWAHWLFPWIKK